MIDRAEFAGAEKEHVEDMQVIHDTVSLVRFPAAVGTQAAGAQCSGVPLQQFSVR